MKINESGRSMIEMLGVLAIIGVLSVGGIAGYSKAMGKHRVNKSIDQITQIVSATRSLFYGRKSYAELSDDLIERAHLFPDELGDGDMTNPFGGSVSLEPAERDGKSNKAFAVEYNSIPEEFCIELATQDWGKGPRSGLVSILINGNEVDGSIAQATLKCSGASNSIKWTFY